MLALPPNLPNAPRAYDFTNEAAFRHALTRYFQQQRTDAVVVNPTSTAGATPGTLVKLIDGNTLVTSLVTEDSDGLAIAENTAVTGNLTASGMLGVTGATTLTSTLNVTGATVLASTLGVSGAVTGASTIQGTQLKSTVAGGMAPLTVVSTTLVSNLTAQYLGASGQDAAYFLDPTHLTGYGAAGGYLRSTGSAWARVSGVAASDLTGTALPSSIVTSSLTTIGTLVAGAVPASLVTAGTFGAGDYTFPGLLHLGTLSSIEPTALLQAGGAFAWEQTGSPNFFRIVRQGQPAGIEVWTNSSTAAANLSYFEVVRTRGTYAAQSDVLAGDAIGAFRFFGRMNSTYAEVARLHIEVSATDTVSSTSTPGRMLFQTIANGSKVLTSRWSLESTGNLWPFAAGSYDIGSAALPVRAIYYAGQLTSSVATGTAPLVVSSTTLVSNLHADNADHLGGTAAASYALLASPALTGTPTAPTATANTNSTQLATTAYVDRTSGAASSAPANPTGTSSTTAKMMGLAGSFTPTKSTKACLTITGLIANTTSGDGAAVQLQYGTGGAPANAAALTGTNAGNTVTFTAKAAGQQSGFSVVAIVTGLTIGTTYWIDAALKAVTGGTASITSVGVLATEE